MANPQPDKFTKISNELIEHGFYKFRISGESWQVLWFILRKTYGFGQKEDHIAQFQIANATGIPRQNIQRAIKKLKAMNIIYVVNNDYKGPAKIGINKDYETWSAASAVVVNIDYKKKKKCVVNIDSLCSQKRLQSVVNIESYKRNKETSIKKGKKPLAEREKIFKYDCAGFIDEFGKEMIEHFYDYWRESNKSKTKMKWEREPTWDLNLRLKNWERMQKQRNGNKVEPVLSPGSIKYSEKEKAESNRIREHLIRQSKLRTK